MMPTMLALVRFHGDEPKVAQDAEAALRVLSSRPGFRWGSVGRSPDEPLQWLLVTVWLDAGSMRRGLGAAEAKIALGPLQASADAGSGVFELLTEQEGSGAPVRRDSDRAADADTTGLGRQSPQVP